MLKKGVFLESNSTFVKENGNTVPAFINEDGKWISDNGKEWDALVEVSQKHIDSLKPSIESLIQAKIQKLDTDCNNEINEGFTWNGRIFGFDQKDDQINIEAIKNNIALGIIQEGTLEYYCKGGECEFFANADFLQLYGAAMTFKTNRIKTCKAMKTLARNSTTVA